MWITQKPPIASARLARPGGPVAPLLKLQPLLPQILPETQLSGTLKLTELRASHLCVYGVRYGGPRRCEGRDAPCWLIEHVLRKVQICEEPAETKCQCLSVFPRDI